VSKPVLQVVGGNPAAFLEQQVKLHPHVIYEFTNYTAAVITPVRKYLFHDDTSTKKPFWIFQKLKKELKESGIEPPPIDRRRINWYHFKELKSFPKSFYSVDITAAYPTALLNLGAISPELYRIMRTKIPKKDRLSSVGMLGTVKSRFTYDLHQGTTFEQVVSETADWFYWCCYVTGEIMKLAAERAQGSYLFYWVDGIAVNDKHAADDLLLYLDWLGYPGKIEFITEAKVKGSTLWYKKDGKQKILSLPKSKKVENEQAVQFLRGTKKQRQ